MRLISTSLIIVCFLLIATHTVAEEPEIGRVGRFQVVTSLRESFLIDTAVGQVWVFSAEYKGDVRYVKWVPVIFMKGSPIPRDNNQWIEK